MCDGIASIGVIESVGTKCMQGGYMLFCRNADAQASQRHPGPPPCPRNAICWPWLDFHCLHQESRRGSVLCCNHCVFRLLLNTSVGHDCKLHQH